jgi:perosamine synthetase
LSKIPYTKPSITELEVSLVADAARNGWGDKCYDYIHRYERDFAEYIGVEYAVATSSATGALTLGYSALGLGFGDEVILAESNWVATVSPLVHLGVRPVFVDIDPVSWCIDSESVKRAITSRTKAIVVTHLYGNLANMSELLSIGDHFGIPIVEDAAEALGSRYKGNHAGSMGKLGVFSFHGTKTLTTGEGGMLVTNDPALYSRILTLSNHGRALGEVKQFWPSYPGYKFKMSNIQAALGCGQLMRIGELIGRKRQIFENYKSLLGDHPSISMNPEDEGNVNSYWMPTVVFDKKSGVRTESLVEDFKSADIDARAFFWPLSSLDFFEDEPKNTVSWSIPRRAINLPTFYEITHDQQKFIADIILKALLIADKK